MTYRQPAPDESAIARAVDEVREIDRHLGPWRSLHTQRATLAFQAATVVFLLVFAVVTPLPHALFDITNAVVIAAQSLAQRSVWARINQQRRAALERAGLCVDACILTAHAPVNALNGEHDVCTNCNICHNCGKGV